MTQRSQLLKRLRPSRRQQGSDRKGPLNLFSIARENLRRRKSSVQKPMSPFVVEPIDWDFLDRSSSEFFKPIPSWVTTWKDDLVSGLDEDFNLRRRRQTMPIPPTPPPSEALSVYLDGDELETVALESDSSNPETPPQESSPTGEDESYQFVPTDYSRLALVPKTEREQVEI